MTYPLISVSVDPTSVQDDAKLGNALKTLAGNDPKLSFHRDAVIGQTIIYGESEEQLDAHLGVLRRDYDVVANVGSWQVAYLETIVRKTETCYTYKGRTGEQGRYARLSVAFEPVDRHTGVIFDGSAVTGTMPPEYIRIIEAAIRNQAKIGVLAGFPTVDFKFAPTNCECGANSGTLAAEIAAKACFRELRKTGVARLMQPIMKVEVLTPSKYVDRIVADLKKKDSVIKTFGSQNGIDKIAALVSLAKTIGYAAALNTLSEGRARYSQVYERHEEVLLP